jgi:hypothetical protein
MTSSGRTAYLKEWTPSGRLVGPRKICSSLIAQFTWLWSESFRASNFLISSLQAKQSAQESANINELCPPGRHANENNNPKNISSYFEHGSDLD